LNPIFSDRFTICLFSISGGSLPIRAWPVENYVALGKKILDNSKNFIVLIGDEASKQENAQFYDLMNHHNRCLDFSNHSTFDELLTLFSMAKILVANDGGHAHFASLIPNLKTFTFYGPESPLLYSPLGSLAQTYYSHYPCSPCLTAFNHRNTTCKDNKCLQAISVETVWKDICSVNFEEQGSARISLNE